MADWNTPTGSSLYTNVLTNLKDRDLSAIKMQEGTTETNLPSGAKRYNTSTNKFETWNGTTWSNLGLHSPIDSHIADTALHFPIPTASIIIWPKAAAPTGFLLCDGAAVSRTTYAALFAQIGTAFGVGDGSTTFNLPNFKARIPMGLDSSNAACDSIGETGGSFNHTHTTPTHTHTIATHTHDMANHVHGQPSHTHTGGAHTHQVSPHYHSVTSTGSTLAINSSGAHTHEIDGIGTTTAGDGQNTGNAAERFAKGRSTAVAGTGFTDGTSQSSVHTHATSDFTGIIGLGPGASGLNGDIPQNTTSAGAVATSAAGNDNTLGPSTNITGGSGTLTTNAGEGGGTSGSANQAYITMNYCIKT